MTEYNIGHIIQSLLLGIYIGIVTSIISNEINPPTNIDYARIIPYKKDRNILYLKNSVGTSLLPLIQISKNPDIYGGIDDYVDKLSTERNIIQYDTIRTEYSEKELEYKKIYELIKKSEKNE
jgi:hypothetical protein